MTTSYDRASLISSTATRLEIDTKQFAKSLYDHQLVDLKPYIDKAKRLAAQIRKSSDDLKDTFGEIEKQLIKKGYQEEL